MGDWPSATKNSTKVDDREMMMTDEMGPGWVWLSLCGRWRKKEFLLCMIMDARFRFYLGKKLGEKVASIGMRPEFKMRGLASHETGN